MAASSVCASGLSARAAAPAGVVPSRRLVGVCRPGLVWRRKGAAVVASAAAQTEVRSPAVQEEASTSEQAFRLAIDENELMSSTWEHRAWVWGTSALLAGTFAEGVAAVDSPEQALSMGLALVAAYFMADFGTGVYHWSVDNYGSGDTPVVGKQIAAFQGHHVKPWTITKREFCNNVHQVFRPAMAPALLLALGSTHASPMWNVWASTFVALACMSQQFHAWSHMRKSRLPEAIIALQDAGILISRKAHGAHHRAPFEGNYCIVSGFWNPILDKNGADDGFFRQLERVVADKTGVEPRCWYEPAYDWAPEEAMEES